MSGGQMNRYKPVERNGLNIRGVLDEQIQLGNFNANFRQRLLSRAMTLAFESPDQPRVIRLHRFATLGLRYLWAAPCTLIGLVAALPMLLSGAQARFVRGVLEVSGSCIATRLPFDAITLGHVVLAHTPRAMARWRRHERVHVRQCERWGPMFFPAYLLAGAWQGLHGRSMYWHNPFEVQARRESQRTTTGGSS
jgi:hypothetical protein